MPTPLPENASLENLRKQAKTLLKEERAKNPRKKLTLSDAQFSIARKYGFSNWPDLKHYFDAVARHFWMPTEGSESTADRFVRLACLNYLHDHTTRRDEARKLLASEPSLAGENLYTAVTVGDFAVVTNMLKQKPALANTRGGPNNWEPLLYAAYSRLNSQSPEHSTLEVARLLLKCGADPNSGFLWDGRYVFTALTGVFGEGEQGPLHQPEHQYCYEFARLLLEAGADPNDSQTLYNRMFTGGTRHLELLFEFSLGKGGDGVWFKRLGSQVASPAEMLQEQMGWAAKYNQKERLRLLVVHGVDVNRADTRLQRTPYELAALNGHTEIAEFLLENGAERIAFNERDAFFASCLSGDGLRARALLAANPKLIEQLGNDRVELLQLAAERDRRPAIRLMVELGFDLNEQRRTTALHNAAMSGHLEMVRLLIELGADPRIRDTEFNARPIGWAQYNGQVEIVEFLKQFED
jgi:ankyrin repeat protein